MSKIHIGATVALNASHTAPFPLITNNLYTATEELSAYGFDSIEYHIRDPKNEIDKYKLKDSAQKNNLLISSLGTGMAYGAEGLSITSPDQTIRVKAIQRLKEHVDVAETLNCYVVIGSLRGKIDPQSSFSVTEKLMIESMKELADYAEKKNVTYVIEAIDRFETNYLCTAEQVMNLIDKVGSDKICVHLDSYHMNIEENSWSAPIFLCKDRLKHFHIADNTRNYPGSGHIPFQEIVNALKSINYSDSITLECFPYPDSSTALSKGISYIKSLL